MGKHVVVLVLGDIGRSPRMQYHARSFSQLPFIDRITVVGYQGEKPMEELLASPKVDIQYISSPRMTSLPSVVRALVKGILLLFSLVSILASIPSYSLIIIQNPPSIPALIVAIFMSFINRSKVLIDWHNLGYSIYANILGESHVLVQISYFLERFLCSFAHCHICVSKALQGWLKNNFSVNAVVLYDRPGVRVTNENFSLVDRHNLLLRYNLTDQMIFSDPKNGLTKEETIQTELRNDGEVVLKEKSHIRTAVVISSTSWTADEDFRILLHALYELNLFLNQRRGALEVHFERVLCVVTGKGDMKKSYEGRIEKLNSECRFVKVRTLWLEFVDYPKLLYCSNLGVSLHMSTSGLDLPMKILDMFGSSLPVAAVGFSTIDELVQEGKNGCIFEAKDCDKEVSSTEQSQSSLTDVLKKLLFTSDGQRKLEEMEEHCKQLENWKSNWDKVMVPLINQLINKM
jgi:beta-1,4-mannosyltransferase